MLIDRRVNFPLLQKILLVKVASFPVPSTKVSSSHAQYLNDLRLQGKTTPFPIRVYPTIIFSVNEPDTDPDEESSALALGKGPYNLLEPAIPQ